jgi:mannosyltransferase
MSPRPKWVGVTLVLAFATLLRVNDLGREGLWHDEAYSAVHARAPLLHIARDSARTDNNPPFYYGLLHGWMRVFGEREVALRSLSVVAGIGGVAVTYGLALALSGEGVALWTALFMSASLFHVLYSREARMYSLLFLFATLSMYAFVKLPGRRRALDLLYIASSVCTFYAHTVGIFVLLAHQLGWVAMRRFLVGDRSIPLGRWVRLQVLVAVCIAPWIYVSSQQARRLHGVFWIPRPTLGTIVDALIEMAGSPWLFLFAGVLAVVGLVALLVAALRPSRLAITAELPPIAALLLLTIWTLVPIALPWLVSFVLVPIFIPRVAIASLAPLTILVALGVAVIRPRFVATVVGLLLLSASTVEVVKWEGRTTKENWRGLTRHVEETAQPGDLVLLHQSSRREGFQYYSRRSDLLLVGFPERRFPAGEFVRPEDLPPLAAIIRDHDRVWLILSDSKDTHRLIPAYLATTYKTHRSREFFGLSVDLFER